MVDDATGEESLTVGSICQISDLSGSSSPAAARSTTEHGERGEQTELARVDAIAAQPGDDNVYDGGDSALDVLVES